MKAFYNAAGAFFALACCSSPVWCQSGVDGPPVQVVVTAEQHKGSAPQTLTIKDVTVRSGRDQLPVLEWTPAQGDRAALELYLLLDDSSGTSLGTQLPDLKKFIAALPANVSISIGYMRDGTISSVQEMTVDHAAAAGKLRLPLGQAGANGSPYFSLSEVAKHWPQSNARREILAITDGVDRYYGPGPDDPYVSEAIRDAHRAGIVISAIYWNGVGHYGHSLYGINWGQNDLGQIADETGGEFYWQGFSNPVSFAPYLEDFADRLNHQYILVFRAKPGQKAGTERIKVQTELKGVDLVAPSEAWVPGAR